MRAQKGFLNRDVAVVECPWLGSDLKKGTVVYRYLNYTYQCIGRGGVAVSDEPNKGPFYEVPSNAVDWE